MSDEPKPPLPVAQLDWPCVECGTLLSDHKTINDKVVCFPLVLVAGQKWREFR